MPANEAIYERVFATGRIRSNKLDSSFVYVLYPAFVALTVVRSAVYRRRPWIFYPLLSVPVAIMHLMLNNECGLRCPAWTDVGIASAGSRNGTIAAMTAPYWCYRFGHLDV